MGETITYKILKEHIVEGECIPGNEIGIRIDQTLTQDATGTMTYLQFEAMGIPKVKTELSVSYVDHNTLQMGFENADDHKYLQTMNAAFGIYHSKAGNGICHQIHLERFGRPGATLLGADSHTPTGGGLGMLSIGAGGIDVAVAMGGGPFFLTAPLMLNVYLTGRLRPWVSAKDIILYVLSVLTTKGNVGWVVEYTGPGVESLTVPQRATIANMGAELGVTASLFPSDSVTRSFLKAQKREKVWRELVPDADAKYDRTLNIDLAELEPMIACPHSPDNVKKVRELKGMKIDQAALGSCTNSSYTDLTTAGRILAGKKVSPDVSFIVAPGSKQVFEMIARSGVLADMIASGARIMESACGFCIGAGQAPITDGVSLRTNNRNFEGRSGTPSGRIYIVSPETAVLSALTGELVNPLDYPASEYPNVKEPEAFYTDDSMIMPPSDSAEEIFRGPNIGSPPVTEPLMDTISGRIGLKVGDKITTDHIMPAGARLKFRSNIREYSKYVFEGIDPSFAQRAAAERDKSSWTAIVGGLSYGQGSSREHAAICPMYLGVRIVMAKSFERIHAVNLINFGILPLIFKNLSDYEEIKQGSLFSVRNLRKTVEEDDTVSVKIDDKIFKLGLSISNRQRKILLAGGLLNYTKNGG